ncbi:MAG: DUF1850 domain-containing protein [Spirochaetaceae bacterium]|nr:DUF1850 domain-containing protein [Spirochaetaceae bacterium]
MKSAAPLMLLFLILTLGALPLAAQVDEAAQYELTICDRTGKFLACIPLENGRFDLVFIHSYHLTPVVERYIVEDDQDGKPILHLFELEYESCGVGMPSDAENGYRLVDGKFELSMDRKFASIPLMISIVEGHGVRIGGKFIPFTMWLPPESMLILAARKAIVDPSGR